jgi:hypothetical protein
MICRTRRFGCGRIIANTRSDAARSGRRRGVCLLIAFTICIAPIARAEPVDPEVARMLERALQEAENLRKEFPHLQYEAKMNVQEWDGRGRLRGTAKAHAIMRPGDARPVTFISREVHGKVRLPDDNESRKDDNEKETTLQEFAREHQLPERFDFTVTGSEQVAGSTARRIAFKPKPNQPEKNRADRFLDSITGTAWVTEDQNKLVKFEMRLMHPLQLFWIFAVLKDLSIEYEMLAPGEILGHSRLKVLFALTTPIYSIRQLHDVDLDKFQRVDATVAANR